MNKQSHGEATLSRLLATDWPDGLYTFEHGISRGRLMQEYLRRAAWWALELDAISKWPFFDIRRACGFPTCTALLNSPHSWRH